MNPDHSNTLILVFYFLLIFFSLGFFGSVAIMLWNGFIRARRPMAVKINENKRVHHRQSR